MRHSCQTTKAVAGRRCLLIGLALGSALGLCSCRSLPQPQAQLPLPPDEIKLPAPTTSDVVRETAQTTGHMPVEPIPYEGLPIPLTNISPWAPPGIAGPWPHDEYLADGGDREVQVNVGAEGELRGLELEDTVAIYDTIDGETVVKPSNRVCLYAPRFAAVRKVEGVLLNEQHETLRGVEQPVLPRLNQEERLATTAIQPIRPRGEIGARQPSLERTNETTVPAISRLPIAALGGGFSPHEDFLVMRRGIYEESEKPYLLEAIDAAITWSHEKAVQVVLDGRQAVDVTGDQRVQATYRVDVPNHPCLRVIKTASTKVARPGDIVDFTIRFDNVGDQAIEHVVLVDNLTTRLEYVPDSARSSREADFSTERNEGESLVLRWEFAESLPAGKGGLVRFHCRVR